MKDGARDKTGSRVLLGAACAYAILSIFAGVNMGSLPAAAESGVELVTWFRDNRSSVAWWVWSGAVAAPVFALMVALLRQCFPAPHRDMFLIGAVAYQVAVTIWSWAWAGLALHADRLNPEIARTVLDVAIFMGPVLTGATTTMMAPVTHLALTRRSGVPLWLGALGVVVFAEQSIETVTIFGATGFTQPGGAMNMLLGGALTLTWMVALGLWGGARGRVVAR